MTVQATNTPAAPKPKRVQRPKDKSFVFKDIINLTKSTGYKASTLTEMRDCIARVNEGSIFHHTYQYFLKGHIQEHTNDLAQWAAESLEERALAEQLSNIDPYGFKSVEDLRARLLEVIDTYLMDFPEPREVLPGMEFFFCDAFSYTFDAGIRARNLAEFLMAIKYVDPSSIYYHFYEARTRLKKESDDFSKWIDEVMKAPDLGAALRTIDPFMNNLEGIRQQIIAILEAGIRQEMEVME
jgi:hypothetical protein